jgi:hypothetical protein
MSADVIATVKAVAIFFLIKYLTPFLGPTTLYRGEI